MRRTYHKSETAYNRMHNICLVAAICAIFFGFVCTSTASDKGNTSLNDPSVQSHLNKETQISGIGYGELLLTFTVNKLLPVFSGRYNYDISGIHVPPISTPVQVESTEKAGYGYNLLNVYIPGKPNNFTVSVNGAKTLSIGIKELPGHNETNEIWKTNSPRAWISTQAKADEKGTATINSDLISPSIYDVKIFGDAAEDASQVNLKMTVVKKLVVNGPYNLSINTTGFPEGDYSFDIKALNGTFRMNEVSIGI